VGEAGLVGAAFFVAGLWRIFATFQKASRTAFLSLRLLGLTGVGWCFHILVLSVAYPVFVTPPTSAMLFGLAGITYVILAGSLAEPAAPEAPGDGAQGSGEAAPRDLVLPGPAVRRRMALARGEVPDQDVGGPPLGRDPQ